jgi:glycosyltransferase involved in cell wall biosynthesis
MRVSRTVDVIVPCYNYGSYLAGCVRSLLDQEGVSVRVLVIDDHSSDNTPEIGLALARSDDRVTFRRHSTNHGHIATYNEGFAWAAADYVLLISADDLLTPGALGRAVGVLEATPGAAFAYGRQVSFVDAAVLPVEPASASAGHDVVEGAEFVHRLCASGDNPVATPTVVVRTSLQHRAGGYTASLPHTADLEMWLRLATLGSVVRLNAFQAFKRMHRANMQHAYVMSTSGDLVERQGAFTAFLDGPGRHLSGAGVLRTIAAESMARHAFWRGAELFDLDRPQDASRLLTLAAEFDGRVRRRPEWIAMALKIRMGTRVWRLVRPAVSMFRRGVTATRAAAAASLLS